MKIGNLRLVEPGSEIYITQFDQGIPCGPNGIRMGNLQGVNNMRYLFEAYVIDLRTDEICYTGPLIARSSEDARIIAYVETGYAASEIGHYDIIVVQIGTVLEKEKSA